MFCVVAFTHAYLDYCRRQGYDFIVDYEAHAERGTPWWKHAMVERLIRQGTYDWIWWLDVDTLITNTEIKLADIIEDTLKNVTNPEEIDWLITHDCNGLNTGSYIVRGHERSIKLFDNSGMIWDREAQNDKHLSDQDALGMLFKDDAASARRTVKVPQSKLNAFPQEIACFDNDENKVWEHGFFVLHFAGAWAHVKGDDPTGYLMRKYQHEVIWGDYNSFD
jgi:mannan polymerase II complex MNN10 subunit